MSKRKLDLITLITNLANGSQQKVSVHDAESVLKKVGFKDVTARVENAARFKSGTTHVFVFDGDSVTRITIKHKNSHLNPSERNEIAKVLKYLGYPEALENMPLPISESPSAGAESFINTTPSNVTRNV